MRLPARPYSSRIIVTAIVVFLFTFFLPNVYSAETDTGSGITVGPPVAEYTVGKGQTVNGVVKVNDYNPSSVTLYPQVSDFGAKDESGKPAFFEPDPNRKFSLSSWIKFSNDPLNLKVGELQAVQYQIAVPEDAEPGGHYGVLFFSTKPPSDTKEGEAKVTTAMKVGQLILVTVPGATSEKANVATFKTSHYLNFFPGVHYSDDKFLTFTSTINFITRLENTGNIHFKPQGNIVIKNIFGQKVGAEKFNEEKGNVLPDSIRKFDNTWKAKWWQMGYYKAGLDLTYGQGQILHDTLGFWIIPWWLITILIVIGLFIWFKVRRKRRKKTKI